MEVFGYCRTCGKDFDAHWHNYPELSASDAVLKPYCPLCKGHDVHITTDESNDNVSNRNTYEED
jgi:Zn finger protein HypA/HybF involved in hydrogenase expression